MEGYTSVSMNAGNDTGYFFIMHTAFYFNISEELPKARKATNNETIASSLSLSLHAKNWMEDDINSKLEYTDIVNKPLECQVGEILLDIFQVANNQLAEEKLIERMDKRRIEEEKRQRRLEQIRKGEAVEIKLLQQAASDWDMAQKVRAFTDCMEIKIGEVTDANKRSKLEKWLKWARDKADWIDPLMDKEDEVLGKSKTIFITIVEELTSK
jgi:hypothetical protein